MAKKKYEEANIQAIAETIRSKTVTEKTYDTSEMADGVNEVYEAGRTKEWSDFWDAFQQNGERTSYQYAFSNAWNSKAFKPKYDIKPIDGSYMFYNFRMDGDVKALLEDCGVVLDTSNATYMNYAFNNAWDIKALPEISFEKCTYADARIQGVFMGCYSLRRIDKVIYPTDIYRRTTNTFQSCKTLSYLRIGGVIGNNFNVSWSPLDVESVKDVILHLKNYAGTDSEYAYTLALSSASKTLLEAEGATSPNGNTWSQYIDDLGWTLL